jgi:hypothetical protein
VIEHLTPEQRAGLRPSVDVDALERLFDAAPADLRPLIVLHFSHTVHAAEVLAALGAQAGRPDAPAFAAAIERQSAVSDFPLTISAPDDPELRALWSAVEDRYCPPSTAEPSAG